MRRDCSGPADRIGVLRGSNLFAFCSTLSRASRAPLPPGKWEAENKEISLAWLLVASRLFVGSGRRQETQGKSSGDEEPDDAYLSLSLSGQTGHRSNREPLIIMGAQFACCFFFSFLLNWLASFWPIGRIRQAANGSETPTPTPTSSRLEPQLRRH